MIASILSTVAVAVLAAAPSDREQIQGSWKLVLRIGDRTYFNRTLSPPFIITTFKGDERLTERRWDEGNDRDTFVLHPDWKPKTIVLHSRDANGRTGTHVGAYEFEGDTLKLCFRYRTDDLPPSDFTCKPGPGRMFWVLQRVRPAAPADPAPAEVVVANESQPGGDPTEIRVAVTNKSRERIPVCFKPETQRNWFKFNLFDEHGREVNLWPIPAPEIGRGPSEVHLIKPGKTVTGYLCPKSSFEIVPGRYLVKVTYYVEFPETGVLQKVESNVITKSFEAKSP